LKAELQTKKSGRFVACEILFAVPSRLTESWQIKPNGVYWEGEIPRVLTFPLDQFLFCQI
jgi:hypothetical protein